MKNQDKVLQEITCRSCRRRFNSNQAIIQKQEQLEVVRQLGNIRCEEISHEVYIAECPYCRTKLAETPICT